MVGADFARRGMGERGFGAVLMIVLVAGIAAAGALFAFSRSGSPELANARRTADALANTKSALVGYAVRRGVNTCSNPGNVLQCAQEERARPGELPCPDTDGDGVENRPCVLPVELVGRVPWRTLGIPEPRDSAGETLWYALSGPFRDWDSSVGSAVERQINSDTMGNITVFDADGMTPLTTVAAAVIFAPGTAIGSQDRSDAGAALCAFTGTTINRRFCADNYLESIRWVVPAPPGNGAFISVTARSSTDASNDRQIHLTAAEIVPALEMRIGAELKALLMEYRATSVCECFPWADTWEYSGGIADVGQNRGRFPTGPFPEAWGQGGIPRLPPWLAANDWHNLIWYSAGKDSTDGGGSKCRTCSDNAWLTVDTKAVAALLFTPGPPSDGLPRLTSAARRDNLALYLESPLNNDGADLPACKDTGEVGAGNPPGGNLKGETSCDTYATPNSPELNRDRIFIITDCGASAATLLASAICSIGGGEVKPVCATAVEELQTCTCRNAGVVMVTPPCRNELNSPQCKKAIAELKTCKT